MVLVVVTVVAVVVVVVLGTSPLQETSSSISPFAAPSIGSEFDCVDFRVEQFSFFWEFLQDVSSGREVDGGGD